MLEIDFTGRPELERHVESLRDLRAQLEQALERSGPVPRDYAERHAQVIAALREALSASVRPN